MAIHVIVCYLTSTGSHTVIDIEQKEIFSQYTDCDLCLLI